MTLDQKETKDPYPHVYVVDSQARYLPQIMAPPPHRQGRTSQVVLYLLLFMALCGIVVEGYFIYHLYNTRAAADTPITKKSQQDKSDATAQKYSTEVKPPKPSAHLTVSTHLPQQDGLMMWTSVVGNTFTHEMDYIEGKLFVKMEGFYFIYSKVFFSEPSRAAFVHTVLRTSSRLSKGEMELMRTFRFLDSGARRGGMLNSYLGGVYLLHQGDAIFVKVHNHTGLLRQVSADNFFGAYML